MDYSREVWPTLKETNLIEMNGLGAPSELAWIRVPVGPWCFHDPGDLPYVFWDRISNRFDKSTWEDVAAFGPTDWNRDGDFDDLFARDISFVVVVKLSIFQNFGLYNVEKPAHNELRGIEDWSRLRYYFLIAALLLMNYT